MKGTLKKCPSCGKFFTCQGEEDCWCEKVNIHKASFLVISQDYNDCICPECLGKYAEK
jgi:hypothetical protein